MKKARQLFAEKDLDRITQSISEAEKKTSGEIVPVVASASGRYDRAEDLFGVCCALLAVAVAWLFLQDTRPVSGDWEAGEILGLGLLPILLIFFVGFLLGTAAATFISALRLPFISKREMMEEVDRGAAEAFHRFRLRGTAGATGILIYVSLYEHMVRILGDSTIAEKLKQTDWDEICNLVVGGISKGKPADGICEGIGEAGRLLAQHFPIEEGDTNELRNVVRFMD